MNVALWIAGRYLRTRRPTAFIALLTGISIVGLESHEIGRIANDWHLPLSDLTTRSSSLEQTFMELTADAVDYDAHGIRREAA